jgi:Fe-S oxidoreductase
MNIDKETARKEMEKMINGEDSVVLKDCVTCFACDEYCPYNSHPFDLKTELQEKFNTFNVPPQMLEQTIMRYKPHGELRLKEIDPEKPVLNKCAFPRTNAKDMEGRLFENLQYVSGLSYFCNLLYHHVAKDSVIKERAPIILDNIRKQGIKEMICFHDECYGFYTSYCKRNNIELPKGFKPIHLFEYIHRYLKDHESEINKLNMKIAYQRSCSNRFVPEIEKYVDKICDLIGAERVKRTYDRENALCCTAPFATFGKIKLRTPTQDKNIQDMIDNNAEACIFVCPMCQETMGSKIQRKGLKSYLLSDLCRIALGEKLNY